MRASDGTEAHNRDLRPCRACGAGRHPVCSTGEEVRVTGSTTGQAIAFLGLLVVLVVVIELAKLTM